MSNSATSAAGFLLQMRLGARIEPGLPSNLVPSSLEDAYRVQAELVQAMLARHGGRRIGYKIACSNELAQRLLNVAAPLYGTLLSFSTHRSPASLAASAFKVRCIEAEFGFEMAQDVPASADRYSAETIMPLIASAFPSIEIVDHRFTDWSKVGAATLVADNAIHGAWIEGPSCAKWRDIDFVRHPVALFVDDRLVQTGSGAAVLGNPLNVVAWLANELPHHGLQLRAGDKISTGVTTDVYFAKIGERIRADFSALGSAEVSFGA